MPLTALLCWSLYSVLLVNNNKNGKDYKKGYNYILRRRMEGWKVSCCNPVFAINTYCVYNCEPAQLNTTRERISCQNLLKTADSIIQLKSNQNVSYLSQLSTGEVPSSLPVKCWPWYLIDTALCNSAVSYFWRKVDLCQFLSQFL